MLVYIYTCAIYIYRIVLCDPFRLGKRKSESSSIHIFTQTILANMCRCMCEQLYSTLCNYIRRSAFNESFMFAPPLAAKLELPPRPTLVSSNVCRKTLAPRRLLLSAPLPRMRSVGATLRLGLAWGPCGSIRLRVVGSKSRAPIQGHLQDLWSPNPVLTLELCEIFMHVGGYCLVHCRCTEHYSCWISVAPKLDASFSRKAI